VPDADQFQHWCCRLPRAWTRAHTTGLQHHWNTIATLFDYRLQQKLMGLHVDRQIANMLTNQLPSSAI
jgi:hypothetical protein